MIFFDDTIIREKAAIRFDNSSLRPGFRAKDDGLGGWSFDVDAKGGVRVMGRPEFAYVQ